MNSPSYRVGVVLAGQKALSYNALRFATWAEAEAYAADLQARWTAVIATRIEEAGSDSAASDDGRKSEPV